MASEQSMIERVARALRQKHCTAMGGGSYTPDVIVNDGVPYWTEWADAARIALEAMREPSEAMLQEGLLVVSGGTVKETLPIADAVWRAMIGAALAQHAPAPETRADDAGGGTL